MPFGQHNIGQQTECPDCKAMARSGNPTFFVTITANLAWPEVKNALLPGQTVGERPDLVARVIALTLRRSSATTGPAVGASTATR